MKKTGKLFALLLCVLMMLSVAAPASLVVQTQAASASSKSTSSKSASSKQTIALNKTKASVYNGKKLKLKVSGTKQTVKWSTSDKTIATVKNGVVTPKKVGKVTIKAQVGKKTLKCKVTVKSPLVVSKQELTIVKGKSKKATVTLYLSGDVACKIGKPSVASYQFGKWNGKKIALKITAKKAGKTYATITNNKTKDVCKIKIIVTEPAPKPETKPLTAGGSASGRRHPAPRIRCRWTRG